MIGMVKNSVLFIYTTVADGGSKPRQNGGLNAILFISVFVGVCLMYVYGIFERYVFDLGSLMARCCSIGPNVSGNIFSPAGVPMTLIVFPVSLYFSYLLCRKVKPAYPGRVEMERKRGYKNFLEKQIALFIFLLVTVMCAPYGVGGEWVNFFAFFALFIPSFLYVENVVGFMASMIHHIRSVFSGTG